MTADVLASGNGWSVRDIVCRAGPHDRPFGERHESVCIAIVSEGTFRYRSAAGEALLGPGALLLGDHGTCFECGHEHAAGDRSLSFHYAPDFLEQVVAALPGVRDVRFGMASLPPLPTLMPLLAAAESARDAADPAALEEAALRLAAAVTATLAAGPRVAPAPSPQEARRITAALRRIEADAEKPLPLSRLAREAAMSPYHFLRSFRRVVGMSPHQFVLRTRMHRAAVRLRRSRDPVSSIAFEAGFNDLSTFNRRFRRLMGATPGAYRAARA